MVTENNSYSGIQVLQKSGCVYYHFQRSKLTVKERNPLLYGLNILCKVVQYLLKTDYKKGIFINPQP